MNTAKLITNDKLNITGKKGTGNCKEREIIYATQYSKHKVLYIRHTGKQLSERFSKLRYDIKNRPDNSKLAKHFHESHNLKILTGKKHHQIKLQRKLLRKSTNMGVWAVGTLSQLFIRGS